MTAFFLTATGSPSNFLVKLSNNLVLVTIKSFFSCSSCAWCDVIDWMWSALISKMSLQLSLFWFLLAPTNWNKEITKSAKLSFDFLA